jgi:phosphopantothenoylcysteine decarboxylase/phosphopantothenate--cysteine ligase
VAAAKLKKGSASEPSAIPLVRNPDVLVELVTKRVPGQLVVGFAAETGDEEGSVLEHAARKLQRKGCDLLVVNDVSGGGVFGQDDNRAVILSDDGSQTPVPAGSKRELAHVIWDRVVARWPGEPG